jgi:hypothetical protein
VVAVALDVAKELFASASASGADVRAIRFLRARVRLAEAGAPTAPLGAGRLDRPKALDFATVEDLRAASALPDLPGARAAWLLAELFAASEPGEADLAQALAAAREHAGTSREIAALAEALTLPVDGTTYKTLAERVDHRSELSLRALGVFLARAGVRDAFEDPGLAEEIAFAGKTVDPVAVAVATDPKAFRPCLTDYPGLSAHLEPEVLDTPDALANELRRCPRSAARLSFVLMKKPFAGFSQLEQIFGLLLAAEDLHRIGERVSLMAGDTLGAGAQGDVADELLKELPGEVANDRYARAVSEGAPGRIEDAIAGLVGIRRLSELEGHVLRSDLDPAARRPFAFRAFLELDRLARLGGATVLPFRARLRRLALPGKLGDWLARVDLQRIVWLATHAKEAEIDPATTEARGLDMPDVATLCFLGSIEAWCPTRPREQADAGLADDARLLAAIGMQWLREQEVRTACSDRTDEAGFLKEMGKHRESLDHVWGFYNAARTRAKMLLCPEPPPLRPEAVDEQVNLEDAKARSRQKSYRWVPPRVP